MSLDKHSESRANEAVQISAWLKSARAGSNSSLGRALESCQSYLRLVGSRALPKKLRSKESLSDLVQRTLHQGAKDFPQFKGNSAPELKAWLHAILRSQSLTIRRHFNARRRQVDRELPMLSESGRRHKIQPLTKEPTPIEEVLRREKTAVVKRALQRLDHHDRHVIELYQYKRRDISWSDIGEELGVSAGAARARWYRAMEKLRLSLKVHYDQ